MSAEMWGRVPGFPDYEVSDLGNVRSSRGRWPGTPVHALTPWISPQGYRQVTLLADGRRIKRFVHALVLLAFEGPRPPGSDIRHLDGDPMNNRLINLAYGSRSENELDKVKHGVHHYAKRSTCAYGHPFAGDNLHFDGPRNRRVCKTCHNARHRIYRAMTDEERAARKAAGLPIADLAAYFAEQDRAA